MGGPDENSQVTNSRVQDGVQTDPSLRLTVKDRHNELERQEVK